MQSRIYAGQVNHTRYRPKQHEFSYRLFMMYLDLDELSDLENKFRFFSVGKFNIVSFYRDGHLGDNSINLKQAVKDFIRTETGTSFNGQICLLTHLNYLGYGFNPVSFYYCYESSGKSLKYIISEVNNTPWNEQHCYLHQVNQSTGNHRFRLKKTFHVSPFMPMDIEYDWRFIKSDQKLVVHMRNLQGDSCIFDATLNLKAVELNGRNFARTLFRYPLMTLKVITAIYFEAFKLWFKRIPFYIHPDKKEAPDPVRKS